MITKNCTKCKLSLTLDMFFNDKHSKDGKCYQCKTCQKNKRKEPEYKEYEKNRRSTLKYKSYQKVYQVARRGNEKDKEARRKRDIKYAQDPFRKLKANCSAKLRGLLNRSKNKRTVEYLGCTIPFLKEYLEKQFLLGMTWDNYGLNGWNIDHRMPIALAKDKNDLLNFLHYSNLQPLWEKQNKVKSDRIICPLMALSLN